MKEMEAKMEQDRHKAVWTLRGFFRLKYAGVLIAGILMTGLARVQGQLPWESSVRKDVLLDAHWISVSDTAGSDLYAGFEHSDFVARGWKKVNVPHNWDTYQGYIRLKHGNLHGDAWYRKRFRAGKKSDQSYFLFFEGVSSYATVYLNGHKIGSHAGGRTSFSFNVTEWLKEDGTDNLLAVKVRHPAGIRDLPWVCGGCSDEVGFSEGSQPFGIFRPVHLIETGTVRIVPFGVHIYNDTTVNSKRATLYIETTVKNNRAGYRPVRVRQQLVDRKGKIVCAARSARTLTHGGTVVVKGRLSLKGNVHLWSLEDPYLYQLRTQVLDAGSGELLDELETPYGIRWIKWPDRSRPGPRQFLLNGKPVFINGIAGYEHALGKSHAFTAREIATRVEMIRSMGFNAFRDAHQPHNLRFQYYWDHKGVLWWPQFSAHIWFDTPAFRKNFLRLLKDWVLERRNSPSNIMWGLQNESQLPEDFARQCVALIRSLDPTASGQRLITTCNGGEGTDWDVPQNWSGTYGGDPDTYDKDLKKEVLVGEYGGWRTMDVHSEGGFDANGPYSIESWCALMEKKIRLAWQVRDSVCGHFLWLFNSHDNPGRVQAGEGFRDLDKIGPVNYKGLLTSWEEPTEAVYLYRSNFTGADTAPMVHIAAHQWAGRWHNRRQAKDVVVYSNCDSVRLYNGVNTHFLGTRTREGIGTHFTWRNIRLKNNILYAVGYHNGAAQVTDQICLRNLPVAAPHKRRSSAGQADTRTADMLSPAPGYDYLYRFNCGGAAFTDHFGHKWAADRARTPGTSGSRSWTADYKGLPPFFASQRRITDPIAGTIDDGLFQTFRYGRDKLDFYFPVDNGKYRVELYFAEPWWGIGSHIDCSGWRSFDVAVNGRVRLSHFDIFAEAGSLHGLKKTVDVEVKEGRIHIDFPETYSGQAVIAAIAIARKKTGSKAKGLQALSGPVPLVFLSATDGQGHSRFHVADWLDTGDSTLVRRPGGKGQNGPARMVSFSGLPSALYGAQWLQCTNDSGSSISPAGEPREARWMTNVALEMYVAVRNKDLALIQKLRTDRFVNTKTSLEILSRPFNRQEDSLKVFVKRLAKGEVLCEAPWWGRAILAFKPVTYMQPPYDQKNELSYDIASATYSSAGSKSKRAGKDCILFASPSAKGGPVKKNTVTWPLVTGVADFHSFHLKYACPGIDSVQARLTLIAADGQIMAASQAWLTPTREGKWNNIYLNTPTMINAGRYRLLIEWTRQTGPVYIYTLKVR